MNKKIFFIFAIFIVLALTFSKIYNKNKNDLPTIAIANYGPHASLEAAIIGLKEQITKEGFVENKNVRYEIADVGFNPALIPQMIAGLTEHHPKVLVAMTTPVAQFAKGKIHNIPLIYNVITDPVAAGLIKEKNKSKNNVTGSSDLQDLQAFLRFVKIILPHAKNIGILYATSESNDTALLYMMRNAAATFHMSVIAIPVDEARDVPIRIQEFKGKVDLIYVGTSGPIQPTLPSLAAEAQKMGIPVFNVEDQAVRDGLVLASFGVNYEAIGRNAGKLVAAVLNGKKVSDLSPIYPTFRDHHGFINKKQALQFGIQIPKGIEILE